MSSSSFTTNGCITVTCKSCGYTWCYKGDKEYATCPRCARKTPVYPISIRDVNIMFDKLKRIAILDNDYTFFELTRVIIINYIREKRIKDSLLSELSRLINHYTNHESNTRKRSRRN